MRESGGGRIETWVTVVPAVALLLVSITLAGGPQDFLAVLRTEVGGIVGAVIAWFAGWM
jgi:hypothetical protein